MGVMGVKKGAQHTSLWRSCAEYTGGEQMMAKFHHLGSVSEEIFDPVAGEWGQSVF